MVVLRCAGSHARRSGGGDGGGDGGVRVDGQVIAGALHTTPPTARLQLTTAANTSCTGCLCLVKTPTITYASHTVSRVVPCQPQHGFLWAYLWVDLSGRFDRHHSNHSEYGLDSLRIKG